MGVLNGKTFKVYDGTSGNVLIGNVDAGDLNLDMKTDEAACCGDSAEKPEPQVLAGKITVKGRHDPADSGLAAIRTKALAFTHINPVKILYSGTVGGSGVGWTCEAIVSNFKLGAVWDKQQSFSIDIQFYGTPSWSTSL